jgi:hypothetical protein
MMIFWLPGQNNKFAKKTKFLPQRRFYVPKASINCQGCPKGIKYKQIPNKHAVPDSVLGVLVLWRPLEDAVDGVVGPVRVVVDEVVGLRKQMHFRRWRMRIFFQCRFPLFLHVT